jgi:hypothetical protein
MTNTRIPMDQAPAADVAQRAAEMLWTAATCEDHNVASSRSPVYRAAEQLFTSAVIVAYELDAETAQEVRDLLSELGPNDAARDCDGWGVASYVQHARRTVAARRIEDAAQLTRDGHQADYSDDTIEWAVCQAGKADVVAVVDLTACQVGPFLARLGASYSVRATSWECGTLAGDADLAGLRARLAS